MAKHRETQTTERTTTIASRDSRRGGERPRRLGLHALLNDRSSAVGSCHGSIPHNESRDAARQEGNPADRHTEKEKKRKIDTKTQNRGEGKRWKKITLNIE